MQWTDQQLNDLNQIAYEMEDNNTTLRIGVTREVKDKKVIIVAIEKGPEGYHGLAVAPIINNEPDYTQIAVVSKGTNVGLNSETKNAINGKISKAGSKQAEVADAFVARVNAVEGYNVVKLTGHSQGAYMLKVGAKHEIPTTVFNGWFKYRTLSDKEKAFMKANPEMFINYRKKEDWLVNLNDGNKVKEKDHYGTIVWVEGSSHKISDWQFDKSGKVIDRSVDKNKKILTSTTSVKKLKERQQRSQKRNTDTIKNKTKKPLFKIANLRTKNEEIHSNKSESRNKNRNLER